MRLIDADKLYPDRMTTKGTLAISQNQIANAPTVEPKKGYWIDTCTSPGMVQCLHCGVMLSAAENIDVNFNFCPNCGADMR